MSMIEIDSNSFNKEVLESQTPVLVDFYAQWCMPCKMLSPTVHEVSDEVSGIKICAYDIGGNEDIPVAYAVQSIPTLMLFDKGEVKRVSVGGVSKEQILELIKL